MCIVIAIKGARADHPLVVAANRDEFYDRPARGPQVIHDAPRAVAGIDERSGGTWMGANAAGLFVALTNQRDYAGADPSLASRGDIVARALLCPMVEAIDAQLESLDARAYNAFNLMYGDARTLRAAYGRRRARRVEVESLDDGLWILPNDRIGSPEFPKTKRARELLEPALGAPWPELVTRLHATLGDHRLPPTADVPPPPVDSPITDALAHRLQALCVHTPVYGTRSSTVLALSDARVDRYLFADGPACESALVDHSELLR